MIRMVARGGDERGETRGQGASSQRSRTDADLMASVGRNLASVYADVLGQPMPPRIADLIERLADATDHRERRPGRGG